jgi:hypothetical protein
VSVSASNILDKVELGEVPGVADAAAAVPNFVHLNFGNSFAGIAGPQTNTQLQTTGVSTLATLYCAAEWLGQRAYIGRSRVDAMVTAKLRAMGNNAQAVNFFKASAVLSGKTEDQAVKLARSFGF